MALSFGRHGRELSKRSQWAFETYFCTRDSAANEYRNLTFALASLVGDGLTVFSGIYKLHPRELIRRFVEACDIGVALLKYDGF